MPKTNAGKHLSASTLVLAAIRERVAALHAVLEPGTDPEPSVDDTDVVATDRADDAADPEDEGGTSVTVPAAPDEVPDTDDDEPDLVAPDAPAALVGGVDLDQLGEALADLDAVVSGFASLIEGPEAVALRAELAWARSTVEEARGLDDTVDLIDDLVGDLEPSLRLGPVEERLRIVTTTRTEERREAVSTMLAQPEFASLVAHADRLVLTAPIAGRKPKHTEKVLRTALADADAAAREAADAAVSEARQSDRAGEPTLTPVANAAATVAATARVVRPVLGKKARKLADAADALAGALGERRRAEAAAHWLVDLADIAHRAGEPGFTYGVLHTEARTRRAAADADLAKAVTAYAKSSG